MAKKNKFGKIAVNKSLSIDAIEKNKLIQDMEIESNKTKSKNTINSKKQLDSNTWVDIFKILPLLFIVGLLPFIIRLKLIPLEGPFYEFWNGEKINPDFFTYYKQIFIYIVTVWVLLHTFFFTKKIKFTKAYYFMGAYAVLVILSTVFSKYPQIALHGFVERKEGMWVILCYLLLMFSTINLVETEKQIKAIIYTLGISGAIISIISIFQYFGMDIFTTEFAKNLMISKEIQAQIEEFSIKFGEKYSYGVFYNPNYLGGYISFYAPLMLSFAIISKDIRERALFAVFFILSIFALYGSRSEAGVLGTVGAIGLLILVLTARYIIKDKPKEEHKKLLLTRFVPILLALIIIPVSLSYIPISENPLARIRTEAVALFQSSDLKGNDYKQIGPINDIKQIDEQTIELKIYGTTTRVNVDKDKNLNLFDKDNNLLFNMKVVPEDEAFTKISTLTEYLCHIYIFDIGSGNYSFRYYYGDKSERINFIVVDGKIHFTTPTYKIVDTKKDLYAKHLFFEGLGKLASNRGYIWSRSMPLVLHNSIIGTGQDTFIVEFPQYDIFGRQAEQIPQHYWNYITDKPHSTYLQIGIHSGLLSLLVVLFGILVLIFKTFKLIFESESKELNLFLMAAIVGFLLSSIFNDSILAITPIIYILIGMNVLLNNKSKI